MQKTELWCDNIGKFTTNVVTQIEPQQSEQHIALFEIHVQLHERFDIIDYETLLVATPEQKPHSPTFKDGWIIYRSLKEFEQLNGNLNDLLPSELKLKFKKVSQSKSDHNY
jgi:hypothetical protein